LAVGRKLSGVRLFDFSPLAVIELPLVDTRRIMT
jgi:hypothetical protein